MKKILSVFLFLFFFLFPKNLLATTDPLTSPNNRFGIHIFDEHDLDRANEIVNSNGGEYGYITVVIREDERDIKRWQKAFDRMRELKIIPIVRLATKSEGENWKAFGRDEIDSWVYFLNSLNWVTQNRYVVIGNEPNHATEWGGKVDPIAYSNFVSDLSNALKNANPDFFVISAGLDASAPNDKEHVSEEVFLKKIAELNKSYFDRIDGWGSHSYPNPAFSGGETATGKGSVQTYKWELNYLKEIGVTRDYPVFITETGWTKKNKGLETKYTYAFEKAWNDPKIVAVTPFIIKYTSPPFIDFSWEDKNGNFEPFVETIKKTPKVQGKPEIVSEAKIIFCILPEFIAVNQTAIGQCILKNTGQSIWESENLKIHFEESTNSLVSIFLDKNRVLPGDEVFVRFEYSNNFSPGELNNKFFFNYNLQKISRVWGFSTHILRIKSEKINYFLTVRSHLVGYISQKIYEMKHKIW